jgi:hypothetical protein
MSSRVIIKEFCRSGCAKRSLTKYCQVVAAQQPDLQESV